MAYKLMVIDDARDRREEQYRKVFSSPEFEPLYIWTLQDFKMHYDTPVDGYVLDVFLDTGDWNNTDAAELLKNYIKNAPRPAPVFLVSQKWGDDRVLDFLKRAGGSKVEQYLAWSEFQQATVDDEAGRARMEALRTKLSSELDRWHGLSGFRPTSDETIRILLLADSQFGDPGMDIKAIFAEHLIANALKRDKSVPDLIALAGDVSYDGRPDQFDLAEERIVNDLMGPLWGNNNIDRYRDRIVLVPGNHDINLRFSACDGRKFNADSKQFEDEAGSKPTHSDKSYSNHHYYAFDPFRRFAHRLTGDRKWLDTDTNIDPMANKIPKRTFNMSWVDRRFIHCGIRFFVLNSVSELDATMPDRASFSEAAMRMLNRSIGDTDDSESIYSIALSHHGLRPLGAEDKVKQIDDWGTVGCDTFSMRKIRLWLYGHYHEFAARSLNDKPFDKTPLWLVQAPTSKIRGVTRGFCILELCRKEGRVIDAYVHHYVLEHNTAEKRVSRRVFDKG